MEKDIVKEIKAEKRWLKKKKDLVKRWCGNCCRDHKKACPYLQHPIQDCRGKENCPGQCDSVKHGMQMIRENPDCECTKMLLNASRQEKELEMVFFEDVGDSITHQSIHNVGSTGKRLGLRRNYSEGTTFNGVHYQDEFEGEPSRHYKSNVHVLLEPFDESNLGFSKSLLVEMMEDSNERTFYNLPNWSNVDEKLEDVFIRYFYADETLEEIAEDYGVVATTVSYWVMKTLHLIIDDWSPLGFDKKPLRKDFQMWLTTNNINIKRIYYQLFGSYKQYPDRVDDNWGPDTEPEKPGPAVQIQVSDNDTVEITNLN